MTLLDWARKVQAIAQNGLAFTTDPFDKERYTELTELVATLLATELDIPVAQAKGFWEGDEGYVTPKVDVRGGIFEDDRVLLVRERSDGRWTLPGGWVDINDSPSGAVVREIREESGYQARAVKLAALIDKRRHPHPPGIHHIYKLFFLCERTGGAPDDEQRDRRRAVLSRAGAAGALHRARPRLADRAAVSTSAAPGAADIL